MNTNVSFCFWFSGNSSNGDIVVLVNICFLF